MTRDRNGVIPWSRSRSSRTCDGGSSLPWVHVPRGIGVLESRVILVRSRFVCPKVNRASQVDVEINVEVSHHPFLVLRPEERHIVFGHIVHLHRRFGEFCSVWFRGRLLWLLFRGSWWGIRGLVLWGWGSVYIGDGISRVRGRT